MKFMLLVYNEPALLDALPAREYDARMRDCLAHADELRRNGRRTTVDGPFAEAKEVLGGFNLIDARDMDEAVEIASHFPWTQTGCIEVRPVRDFDLVRQQVGAPAAATALGAHNEA